jgi:hypothetical protein
MRVRLFLRLPLSSHILSKKKLSPLCNRCILYYIISFVYSGPKAFLVVSDPVMARHVLREVSPEHYCKGMLAEILEPIMGKGLIPADPKTWKVRE